MAESAQRPPLSELTHFVERRPGGEDLLEVLVATGESKEAVARKVWKSREVSEWAEARWYQAMWWTKRVGEGGLWSPGRKG